MRTTSSLRLYSPKHSTGRRSRKQSGIALITVLFLMILMTILGLTMVVSVNSDMMINGYYGNARASYYAADSGLNVSRQYLSNYLEAAVNFHSCTGWQIGNPAVGCTAAPLGTGSANQAASQAAAITAAATQGTTVAAAALTSLLSTYGSFSSLTATGSTGITDVTKSWNSNFILKNTANCTNSFVLAPPGVGNNPSVTTSTVTPAQISTYTYTFNYNLCATGQASSTQRAAVTESGSIILNILGPTNQSNQSFAAYGGFIQNYPLCDNPLVPGFFSGPQFSNTAFNFWNNGSYVFNGAVGQVGSQVGYWIGGTCYPSATTSYPGINAQFQKGYNLNQAAKVLPPNTFSQKWAVIDGNGCGEAGSSCTTNPPTPPPDPSTLTPNPLTLYMKNVSGTAYAGTGTSGVYLPYTSNGGAFGAGTPSGVGGGFYIEGSASIVLSPGVDGSGNPTQIYQITQGTNVTTIVTNPGANGGVGQTTVACCTSVSAPTLTLTGVPVNESTGGYPATLLYVDGTITGLTGPGQGQAAVQNNSMITITGSGNIDITGDVIYKTEVVTLNNSDTAINLPASASTQVLGIFTSNGNIQLNSPYSNSNLQVDGSLAALGSSCPTSSCGFVNLNNSYINTFNNVGGQIQSNIFSANMSTENTFFDPRLGTQVGNYTSFAPPWFPSTNVSNTNVAAPPTAPISVQRYSWAWIASQ